MKRMRAFTLMELIVVITVMVVLMGILLPSLGRARAQAKAVKCGAQMHSVAVALAVYLAENEGVYPPSYWYPNADGTYDFYKQDPTHPNGYAHWSSFLFNYTKDLKAFTCPEFSGGGLPRTNPGKDGRNWADGQTDQTGNSNAYAASVEDRQSAFVAFTANGAIMPRNKFTADVASADGGNGKRLNTWVKQNRIAQQARTILMTEFNTNWRATAAVDASNGNALAVKSHRPINPFVAVGGGTDEFKLSLKTYFSPTRLSDLYTAEELERRVGSVTAGGDSLIEDKQSQLNAVGRNHVVAVSKYGGKTNFLFLDGHIELKSIVDTLGSGSSGWEWGQSHYAVNGDNHVQF